MADLQLYRGVTYPSRYQHRDSEGNNLPLTGCTVYFTIKKTEFDEDPTDATAIFKVAITSHTDAAAGITDWDTVIPATGIDPGDYHYDIVVKDGGNKEAPPVLIGGCAILGKRTNL